MESHSVSLHYSPKTLSGRRMVWLVSPVLLAFLCLLLLIKLVVPAQAADLQTAPPLLPSVGVDAQSPTNQPPLSIQQTFTDTITFSSITLISPRFLSTIIDNPDDNTTSMAAGDMDNDGDLDLVAGRFNKANVIYWNDGNGNFTPPVLLNEAFEYGTTSIALGDLNNDGWLDVVAGNGQQRTVVYINARGIELQEEDRQDSSAHSLFFPKEVESANDRDTRSVALGDLDGIHGYDIWIGNQQGADQICLNNGSGEFACKNFTETSWPTTSGALGHLDDDNFLDLVVGHAQEETLIYLSNGNALGTTDFLEPCSLDKQTMYSTTVAIGDVAGDGSPPYEVAIANYESFNTVYRITNTDRREDGSLSCLTKLSPFGREDDKTTALQLADLNGDGHLDILAGNDEEKDFLYLNTGTSDPQFDSMFTDGGQSFRASNSNRRQESPASAGAIDVVEPISRETRSLVTADFDNDGDLDIAVGNYKERNRIYDSNGAGNFHFAHDYVTQCETLPRQSTGTLTVDLNNDGYYDGTWINNKTGVVIELSNHMGEFLPEHRQVITGAFETVKDAAFGDLNGDDYLDMVVGSYGTQNFIYYNDGSGRYSIEEAYAFGDSSGQTRDVAVADVDGDGDLDIVAANISTENADVQKNYIFLNDGSNLFELERTRLLERGNDNAESIDIILTDLPEGLVGGNDGLLDIVIFTLKGEDIEACIYPNRSRASVPDPANAVSLSIEDPKPTEGDLLTDKEIEISYEIFGPDHGTVSQVKAYYSLNRGGNWYTATATLDTETTDLPVNHPQTFTWDTFTSKFLGQATDLLFRMEAYPIVKPLTNSVPGPYMWPYAAANTRSLNIRGTAPKVVIQPTDTVTSPAGALIYRLPKGQVSGAKPFQNPMGQPFRTDADGLLRAPSSGYANGFEAGERWIALLPVHNEEFTHYDLAGTTQYTLYYTSIAPQGDSLPSYVTVNKNGNASGNEIMEHNVYSLPVASRHPLLIFDLTVSLEWDARNSQRFITQLVDDIERASELIYVWTEGQVALGTVKIYHDRVRWTEPVEQTDKGTATLSAASGTMQLAETEARPPTADIRIYASNRLRPNADVGGVAQGEVQGTPSNRPRLSAHIDEVAQAQMEGTSKNPETEIDTGSEPELLIYKSGQVRMGTVWNRYGDLEGAIGDDWARALAHELGHYLLRVYDSYLGIDEEDRLLTFTKCQSVMANPYVYNNFLPADKAEAEKGCGDKPYPDNIVGTLNDFTSGLTEWQIISETYPALYAPEVMVDTGPSLLALAVTQVITDFSSGLGSDFSSGENRLLPRDRFVLVKDDGSSQDFAINPSARAFLFNCIDGNDLSTCDRLIDLGNPEFKQVKARGIGPGDRLCVYDFIGRASPTEESTFRAGCHLVPTDEGILSQNPDQNPQDFSVPISQVATDWPPDVAIEPGNPIGVQATFEEALPEGSKLWARLYPLDLNPQDLTPPDLYQALPPVELEKNSNTLMYENVLPSLPITKAAGYIHIWQGKINKPDDNHEMVIDFTQGGSPCCQHVGDQTLKVSPDGSVIFYALNQYEDEDKGQPLYTLQSHTILPDNTIPWATQVGQAYRLQKSDNAPDLDTLKASLLFSYLERDVPPGEEPYLKIYFGEEVQQAGIPGGNTEVKWKPLVTRLNQEFNTASVLAEKPGIYVLLSTIPIPLEEGWNMIGYPLVISRSISSVLYSIEGSYTYVMGHDQEHNQWLVHPQITGSQPDSENKPLNYMQFGHGYWIHATEPIILYLKGTVRNTALQEQHASSPPVFDLPPPITQTVLYGVLTPAQPVEFSSELAITVDASSSVNDACADIAGRIIKHSPDTIHYAALIPPTCQTHDNPKIKLRKQDGSICEGRREPLATQRTEQARGAYNVNLSACQ